MPNKFAEITKKDLPLLIQYVPVVDRVHGEHHPEFHEVRSLFNTLVKKIKEAGEGKPDLNEELAKLRQTTDNYTVPSDVCETYEAVYVMLKEVDEAYQA